MKTIKKLMAASTVVLVSNFSLADTIDPEIYIQKNGHQSVRIGDDGRTKFFSATERATKERITILEREIEKLPKREEVQKMCDFMRGGIKAKLIQQNNTALDVALTNYGNSGSTVVCILKYMQSNQVGTQLIYSKKSSAGMYQLYITD